MHDFFYTCVFLKMDSSDSYILLTVQMFFYQSSLMFNTIS